MTPDKNGKEHKDTQPQKGIDMDELAATLLALGFDINPARNSQVTIEGTIHQSGAFEEHSDAENLVNVGDLIPSITYICISCGTQNIVPSSNNKSRIDHKDSHSVFYNSMTDTIGNGPSTAFVAGPYANNFDQDNDNAWYSVYRGRKIGAFQSWRYTQTLVSGVSHACFKRQPSKVHAIAAFEKARAEGMTEVL